MAQTATVSLPPITETEVGLSEAADEGVHRLNVVLRMLRGHQCGDTGSKDDEGGYDLLVLQEQIGAVRDLLRAAAASSSERFHNEKMAKFLADAAAAEGGQ